MSEDTVMSDDQIEKWLKDRLGEGNIFEQFNRQFCKDFAKVQAEISHQAGLQAGRKEVVEFVKEVGIIAVARQFCDMSSWHSKLKEWGGAMNEPTSDKCPFERIRDYPGCLDDCLTPDACQLSRSIQRRIAAQKKRTAPDFSKKEKELESRQSELQEKKELTETEIVVLNIMKAGISTWHSGAVEERVKEGVKAIETLVKTPGQSEYPADKVEAVIRIIYNPDNSLDSYEERVRKQACAILALFPEPELELLTQEEGEAKVREWYSEDVVRLLSLNRGHWEDVIPIIAKHQLDKDRKVIRGETN